MIPATAHFIWYGTSLPWTHVLAVRSAAARGGFERLVLHCGDDLRGSTWWGELAATDRLEIRSIDVDPLFEAVTDRAEALGEVYRSLRSPAALANVVRAALLHRDGGVYLDLDTVTVASLDDLRRDAGVFFGEERIALPGVVVRSRRPDVLAVAGARMAGRELCRRSARGWSVFRRLEPLYARGANNAVLAGEAGHPFLARMLDRMIDFPAEDRGRRYALGTHLLQDVARTWVEPPPGGPNGSVVVHDPAVFFPVAPEVSEHWFRTDTTATADDLVRPETRVVHWYASVRTSDIVTQLTPARLSELRDRQPFAQLVAPFAESKAPSNKTS